MDTEGEFPIAPKDGEFPIEWWLEQDIQAPDDQERELCQEEKQLWHQEVYCDNSAALVGHWNKINQELLHIVQGNHQGDHQEAGQEEELPWVGNAIWDEEQPSLQEEFFRNISAPSELVVGFTSAPKTIEIKVELQGSKSKDKLYQEEEQSWLQDESFCNNYAAVAQRGLLMGQSDQGVDSNNSAMLALSSSVAQPPLSATQRVPPKNFELGCSSVAQPPPSTTQTVCPVNFELGSSNIARPPSSTIPIKVLVGGGHGYQQHQYTIHVKPDEEVVVLRKLLKKRRVTYLPQHYLFAFKRGVMNEDMSFRDHGIVSVQDTKIEVMDFTVHFPPHHPLREAGIASNPQLAIRR